MSDSSPTALNPTITNKHVLNDMLKIYLPQFLNMSKEVGPGTSGSLLTPYNGTHVGVQASPDLASPGFFDSTLHGSLYDNPPTEGPSNTYRVPPSSQLHQVLHGMGGRASPGTNSTTHAPSTSAGPSNVDVRMGIEAQEELPEERYGAFREMVSCAIGPSSAVEGGSPNHRRNLMRRQRTEFLRNSRNMDARGSKTVVTTDAQGNVLALRSVLNRAIREIAGRVSDVSLKEFRQHPPMAFQLIEHDIHSQFSFEPAPL